MEQAYYSVYMYGTLYAEKCTLEAETKLNIRIERVGSEVEDDN